MNWSPLTELAQLDAIDTASADRPVLIFKHSTRCNISRMALHRLESAWTSNDNAMHVAWYLDLLRHRDLSHAIAMRYGIEHASPQALVVRSGGCVHAASHFGISYRDVLAALKP